MYRKELQTLLLKNNFPNIFFLYGADNFQIELYANFIKKKWTYDENLKLFFEEYHFNQASDFLSGGSLFSNNKLLELKINKKIPTKELKTLVELCHNNQNNFFLLEFYDESSKQSDIEKIFGNNFARFFQPNNAKEGIELLAIKAKELNIEITQNALFMLFTNFNENLYLAASELNKFTNLTVSEQDIDQYCHSLSSGSFENFFELILKKLDFKNELEKIIENYNEIALLNYLSAAFYRLFKIAIYAKIYGKVDLKELLGYSPPPLIAQKLSQQAFSIKIEQYKNIFTLLLKSEHELKTNSKLAKKEFLISNLLELGRIIKI
ncbi:DNA polymerase III subunit delta [Campylobacter sp. LH-2024]|uniref:DNA polymerase III subunit delta n=1 Tax=Campylobacter molothri TaxID=1032242 RepID=A0ACC5W2J0_9BACT|nr:DNA polymerase III subunit delta [Campylobacter sp. RM10542]MBZ7937760.1 DNA polymerase III subunit delta [Campylobacter sp. RM10538]MBZ7940679.1 DNA polymerase III subunit delta [Campylobacter sp. W0047]MBZ7941601.1 DNA polymerase III subunit delta [Campylobacter sp. W0045]MBZ7946062.1 DNA polymerase III subunit delta [Campylobacter sp. RM10536]MBZ7947905.1 DNA polymerase III subunit delta [Campylobacter sp. RM9929]MBZ7950643.1 DNA polymerase III subunit delta [Campylobacter sp. W0046]MB